MSSEVQTIFSFEKSVQDEMFRSELDKLKTDYHNLRKGCFKRIDELNCEVVFLKQVISSLNNDNSNKLFNENKLIEFSQEM